MADKEISALTAAGALDGTELVHVVKGGNSRQSTTAAIAALALATGGGPAGLTGSEGVLRYIYAQGTSGTLAQVGGIWGTQGGTGSSPISTTNRTTRSVRHSRTTGTGANLSAGLSSLQAYSLDVGFTHEALLAIEAAVAGYRMFIGGRGSTGITLAIEPSALGSIVGFGLDGADTHIQLLHNDAAGAATKTATTIARPASGDMLFTHISAEPSGDIYCLIQHFLAANIGSTPDGEWDHTLVLGSEYPALTQLLTCGHAMGNAASGASGTIAMMRESILSPF